MKSAIQTKAGKGHLIADAVMDTSNQVVVPKWLSVTMACKYASMSDKTLMRYVKDGNIYGTKKHGKWYIDRHSIDEFMNSDKAFIAETIARLINRVAV